MATNNALQRAKREAAIPSLALQGDRGGQIRSLYDTFALSADLASGDVIRFGKIPGGARIVDVRMIFTDLDVSGGTLNVGWQAGASGAEGASASGFGSAIDVTSAGVYSMFTSQSTAAGQGKLFVEEVEVVVATSGDTDATTGSITLEVLYVID